MPPSACSVSGTLTSTTGPLRSIEYLLLSQPKAHSVTYHKNNPQGKIESISQAGLVFNTLLHLSDCNILGFSTPFTAPASEVPQEDAHFSAQACTSYNHNDYTQYIRQAGIPQQFKQRESCAEYHGKKKIMSRRLTKPLSSLLAIP